MHNLAKSSTVLELASRTRLALTSGRLFSATCFAPSGHSRWSKIKHDKAKVDAGRSKIRSYISQSIKNASKLGGPDPKTNATLAAFLVLAKKNDFPKAAMERAIASGQGLSMSGAPLESVTVEFMQPPGVAGILEIETESRNRAMQELRHILKEHKASMTPCAYMFDRRGRITYEATEDRTEEAVLDSAIEAGAIDVETDEDDGFVIWTEPDELVSVAEVLSTALNSTAKTQGLVYRPKDTVEGGEDLPSLIEKLEAYQDVQEVYLNTT